MSTIINHKWLRIAALTAIGIGYLAGTSPSVRAASNPVPVLSTKDKVAQRVGVFRNGSGFTASGGGRTAAAGDYAVDFTSRNTGPVYVQDASFFNVGAATDQMTVAFWAKKYDIAAGSAFWANSTASPGTRGYQVHVPWNNNNIYFDTSGCCNSDTRINAGIDTFPDFSGDTTDISWWTNSWHHFAFTKNGANKQIWINGKLFLEGFDAIPLFTDFTDLYIGSDGAGGGLFHALMDDFAVYSTPLSEADLLKLATGTLPNALGASTGLVAYWDFNDYPSDGFFAEVSPTPNTTSASPNVIRVVHVDGTTPWTSGNVTLTVDGAPVTPVFSKEGGRATISYTSPNLLAIQSKHKAAITFPGTGGVAQTIEWEFTIGAYTKDSVAARLGTFTGGSGYTGNAGGFSGKPGDYAVDFGPGGTGPVQVDGAFLNAAAANDEVSFAFWVNKYDIAASSVFWAVSPSSNNGERGYQAHVPWSDNTIYFDTAGCCTADLQRVNLNITEFAGYTGDISWWQTWHHFVFSKKGESKQVWIDGQLFIDGTGASPLPTDFTRLVLGADNAGNNRVHAILDEFAVFSTQLTPAQVNEVFVGAKPSALPASAGLMAYWDFNDIPPQGIFLSFAPAPDSTNAVPNSVKVVHLQGTTPWDLSKVSLKIDGNPVAASATLTGSRVTVNYVPNPIFAIGSSHTATLNYPNPDGTVGTQEWQFTVAPYTKDSVSNYVGRLVGPTKYTANQGGRTGQAGDYGMDLGRTQAGQGVHLPDPTPLNLAAANDEMAIAGWHKLYSLASSAFFFGVSPSSSGGQRGWGSFPWGDSNFYFDTAGCCNGESQRISGGIADFGGYTDAGFWTNWHHFVYQKKGEVKEIWIDGVLFLQGTSTSPLPKDFTESYIGVDVPDNARMQGIVDDFAIFGTALDQANVSRLFAGDAPTALPASTKLLAYWNFNDAISTQPPATLTLSRQAGKWVLTFTGTLEGSDTLLPGSWAPVANATSPMDLTTTGARRFYRSRN